MLIDWHVNDCSILQYFHVSDVIEKYWSNKRIWIITTTTIHIVYTKILICKRYAFLTALVM